MSTIALSGSTALALSYRPYNQASNVTFNNVGLNMYRPPIKVVTITAIQVTGNVVTMTAANTFSSGDTVLINLTSGAFTYTDFNGIVTVTIGGGPSFQFSKVYANFGPSATTGTGTQQNNAGRGPFTSTDYGKAGITNLAFANYGTVARARSSVNTFPLKNESFLTFTYDYQNLTRQRPKIGTATNSATFSQIAKVGRNKRQVKTIGFIFDQSNVLVRGHTFTGPTAITFGQSNSVIRNRYVPLSGITSFLSSNVGDRIFNPGLSQSSAFAFAQIGTLGSVKHLSAVDAFLITQGGYSV